VEIYDSEGNEVDIEFQSDYDGSFSKTAYLIAGETYRFHIYTHYEMTDFRVTISMNEGDMLPCRHRNYLNFAVLPEGVTSCEDGVLMGNVCKECGMIFSAGFEYQHDIVTERINLEEYGACGGELYYESCACGENVYFNDKFYCETEWKVVSLGEIFMILQHWIRKRFARLRKRHKAK
jgi:hypothetical protein